MLDELGLLGTQPSVWSLPPKVIPRDWPRPARPENKLREYGGRYLCTASIGSGGMGEVFRAVDVELDREVAVKVLKFAVADSRRIRGFLDEARRNAGMEHPSIVPLYDVGSETSREIYFVMKLVEGSTLGSSIVDAKRSPRPPFDPRQRVRILRSLAEARASTHDNGLIHRDLKPSNVMIGRHGEVQLMDWGVAAPYLTDVRSEWSQRGDGVSGTPAYMAPEQMMGNAVDARADIYATGVMLYELLTGRKPYPGGGVEAMFQAIHNTTVTPPSALVPALPEALDTVVLRAMQIDPGARFADAREMQAALDAAITGADQNTMIEVTAPPGTDPSHGGSDTMLNRMSVDTLRRVERHLTTSMGPMGSVIARRVAATARNAQEMLDAVLQDIPDETERTALRRVIERALHDDGAVRTDALTDTTLAQLGKLLPPYLGPIAPVLVKRHAATAVSHADLASVLADMINNPPERQQFLTEARALV